MLVRFYINNTFSNALMTDILPRIGEAVKFNKNEYRVTDIIWRMKGDGTELLHARVVLK